jgi:type IV pilus assembly protein PilA
VKEMMRFLKSRKAFTLVELMIVVAIIGILAGIAIPRYMNFVRRSREGATKGNLGAIRSALNIYYSDMDGFFPARITDGGTTMNGTGIQVAPFIGVTANNYLDTIPPATEDCAQYGAHRANTTRVDGRAMSCTGAETGGWTYQTVVWPAGAASGAIESTAAARVVVNCSQLDTKGTTISQW